MTTPMSLQKTGFSTVFCVDTNNSNL